MWFFLKQDPDPGSGSAFKILICRIWIRPKMGRIRNPAANKCLLVPTLSVQPSSVLKKLNFNCRIRIQIPNLDPDPDWRFESGSTWIRIRNTWCNHCQFKTVHTTMNDRLIRVLTCHNPDPRDVELVLLISVYDAITSILYYPSVAIVKSRIIVYSEELMFTFATYTNIYIYTIYENLQKIQEIREFSSHTDWEYKQARLFVLITMSQGLMG